MSDSIKSTDPRIDITKQGIAGPLRRDQANDFASANGFELAKSNLRQLVGTQRANARGPGEVAWDGAIGSETKLSVHRNGSAAMDAVTAHRIQEAARRELPNITLTSIKITRRQKTSYVAIKFVPTDGYGAEIGEEQSLDVPMPET
jgi:hypothetical protein